MCGVCGEIRFDGRPADAHAVARMTDAMAARGPDSDGVFARGPIALGHRRLSIIDLSPRGGQPMIDSDLGLALVFNGCIYNYRALREELEGHGYRFFSDADSEVILKAFHRWGADCVRRLVGMFAVAIVELDSGTVTLARDRLGIKPLYLSQTHGRLRFASTVQALLAAGDVDTSIDRYALHHYLSFHSVVPAPRTMFAGVEKLPPATIRTVRPDGRSTDTTYWRAGFERTAGGAGGAGGTGGTGGTGGNAADRSDWGEGDWQEALLESLRVAVSRRMVADVPVGVLLSGGFDSSLIVALLAEQGQHGLETFSIGFDSAAGESGDEYVYSDLVAQRFGTHHHRIHIDTDRLVPAVAPTIAAMSEPMVSHDCIAFYLLSQEVARHVKVVQSGQGADEILAGYDWYPPLERIARTDVTEHYRRVFFDRDHAAVNALLSEGYTLVEDPSLTFVTAHQAGGGAQTALDAALRLDTEVMLVDDPVKRVDTMTMAWGLEGRVPFLDHEFVELAAACPPHLKLAGGGKGILKEAARGLVPHEVIDRTKGYFPVPGIRHLEGEVLDLVADALTNEAARARGLFRPEAVARQLDAPNADRTTLGSNALWQVAVLELWLQGVLS